MEPNVLFAESGYQLFKLTIFEHTGIHIDTPLHLTEDGTSIDELDPQRLMCPLCVVDISAKAMEDANAMVEAADIEAWVSANGAIPAGACVAMHSGWAAKVGAPEYRNTPDGNFAFPGFDKSATDMLAEMDVACIGVDTLSLDPGNSADFAVHYSWLPGGRYGIENLADLDKVPVTGATVFVGAPTHWGHRWPRARARGGLMATQPMRDDASADPAALAIFDDIRTKRNTDYVNNFWRVLANDPDLLQTVWNRA